MSQEELTEEFNEICQEINIIKNTLTSVLQKLNQYKKKVDKIVKETNKDEKKSTTVKGKGRGKKVKEDTENNESGELGESGETDETKVSEKKPRAKRTPKKKVEPPSAITEPTLISDQLATFLKRPSGTRMLRTEVTKELYKYINDHNLQNQNKKMIINTDEDLAKLLDIDQKQELTYFKLQPLMNKHFLPDTEPSPDNN